MTAPFVGAAELDLCGSCVIVEGRLHLAIVSELSRAQNNLAANGALWVGKLPRKLHSLSDRSVGYCEKALRLAKSILNSFALPDVPLAHPHRCRLMHCSLSGRGSIPGSPTWFGMR